MIVNVSEVTPSIWINARSIKRPTQKPVTAPTVEPQSRPVKATSRGERSTLTPNTGTSETTLICMNTITIESTATRHRSDPGSQAVPDSLRPPREPPDWLSLTLVIHHPPQRRPGYPVLLLRG